MDWQAWLTGTAIVLALGYTIRSMIRSWQGESGCGAGCGSCSNPPAPAAEEHSRRISLPQVK